MSEALKTQEQTAYQLETAWRDDTHTWLAEVLDGQMRSEFTYQFNGEDLIARGGQSLGEVFTDSIANAEEKVAYSSAFSFELRRRKIELGEYEDMLAMARGDLPNTMVVISDFPPELMGAQGDTLGYNVTRKQTMMRVIMCSEDGNITSVSQSLDGSNRAALEAIYGFMGTQPEYGELLGQRIYKQIDERFQGGLSDTLMRVYDQKLEEETGVEHFAGRTNLDKRNTMDFAVQQSDLIDAYLTGPQDDDAKFKLAAAITARFDGRTQQIISGRHGFVGSNALYMSPIIEMEIQGRLAAQAGKTYSGCGGSVSMSAEAELSQLGYGDADKKIEVGESDRYGLLTFKCQKGHTNKRPRGKLIECCKTCGVSVKC